MSAPLEGGGGTSPLEDIEFIARSAHRVAVLDTLAERPLDRDALRDSRAPPRRRWGAYWPT